MLGRSPPWQVPPGGRLRPFVEAGIPTFVDKPFTTDLKEGIAFVRMAKKKKVPITSYSVLSIQQSSLQFAEEMKKIGQLRTLVTTGPVDIESQWGGVFFYAIHQVDLICTLVSATPLQVSTTRHGPDGVATITFDDGSFAVVHCFKEKWGPFTYATAHGTEGAVHAGLPFDENPYLSGIKRFCKMFETGVQPVPPATYSPPGRDLGSDAEILRHGAPGEGEEGSEAVGSRGYQWGLARPAEHAVCGAGRACPAFSLTEVVPPPQQHDEREGGDRGEDKSGDRLAEEVGKEDQQVEHREPHRQPKAVELEGEHAPEDGGGDEHAGSGRWRDSTRPHTACSPMTTAISGSSLAMCLTYPQLPGQSCPSAGATGRRAVQLLAFLDAHPATRRPWVSPRARPQGRQATPGAPAAGTSGRSSSSGVSVYPHRIHSSVGIARSHSPGIQPGTLFGRDAEILREVYVRRRPTTRTTPPGVALAAEGDAWRNDPALLQGRKSSQSAREETG